MTKLFRHSILLLAALCLAVACKDNAIVSDTLGTESIKQGRVSYDTLNIDLREATADTISIDEAVNIAMKLSAVSGPTSVTQDAYYIIGYVGGFSSNDNETSMKQYGNRFPILRNKVGNKSLVCYQMLNYRMSKFSNMDQLQIGDQIVVCGHLQNRNNAPQVAGGFLMTTDNPANPKPEPLDIHLREAQGDTIDLDEAIRIGFSMPSSTSDPASTSTKEYLILGYVAGFDAQDSESSMKQYGNRYPILTNKRGDRFMLCYRVLGLGGKKFTDYNQLQVGDQVVVKGKIQNRLNAPQITQGGYIVISDNPNISARTVASFPFDKDNSGFTVEDKTAGTEAVWSHIESRNGNPGFMRAVAKAGEETESWLISPALDMTICTHGAQATFSQYFLGNSADRPELLQIKVSDDGGDNWATIPDDAKRWNDGTLPQFQSVTIDLKEYISAQTKIAFVYKSTADKNLTWGIKNLVISEPEF